jgi:HD-like signal output (HDOD) protein
MGADSAPAAGPVDEPLQVFRRALAGVVETGNLKLPLLPQVAGEVLTLINDPNVEISELSSLIHRDQALAGHVLRISNSAAFGGGERIVSLQQAITRLGMKLLSEVALAMSLQGEVFRAPGFEAEVKRIWRHALASGAYGKEAARMKRTNVEGQFLCGLLHTFGKPVLLQVLAELNRTMQPALASEAALELVDEFHGRIGQRLAAEWKLPQQLQVCCAHYKAYDRAPAFQDEAALTYLADRLASWLVVPEIFNGQDVREDPVFERLNFYPDEVESLLGRKEDVLALVNAMDL